MPTSSFANGAMPLFPGLSVGRAKTVEVRRKRKGVNRQRRRQTAGVWLVLSLTLLLGAVQQFWHYPSGWWLYVFHFPVALMVPLVLVSAGLSLRSRHKAATAIAMLLLGCLLGPLMGRVGGDVDGTQPPVRIRVISVNAQSWSADRALLAKGLAGLHPDILLFQEMWWLSHQKNVRATLPRFLFRGDATGREGLAIGTHLPLTGVLHPPPPNVLANVVEIEGRSVLLVTVHGRKKGGFSPEALEKSIELQRQQCRELLAYIDSFHLPIILGGDLNSPPYGPLSRGLRGQLKDSFHKVGEGYGYTFPTVLPLFRIDSVFVSPELGPIISCRAVDVGSDHLAVVVDIEVSAKLGPEKRGRSLSQAKRGR